MTPYDRYLAYAYKRHGNVPMCCTCRYFVQHYGYCPELGYYAVHAGHCTEPRCKMRMPFDMCNNWEPRKEETPWQNLTPSCAAR